RALGPRDRRRRGGSVTSQRQQVVFWLGALAAFFVLFYLLSPILLPFGAGFMLLLFVVGVLVVLSLLVPLVELQAAELVRRVPALVADARERMEQLMHVAEQQLAPEDVAKLRDILGSGLADIAGWAVRLVQGVLTSSVALANLLSLVFVTPIVAFFLLRDWPRIVAKIDAWLPRHHLDTIREQARLADATLAGFVRGQLLVCLGTGIYYAT